MNPFPLSFPRREVMLEDLREIGFDADEKQLDLFGRFACLLLDRSATSNLIGPGERGRIWRRHFLESVSYGLLIDRNRVVVDIGSGNGFPGIVLAILGFQMILLEPRRKRHLFLNWAVKKLGIDNCNVEPLRLEDFRPDCEVKQFVARSVAPPPSLLEIIGEITGTGSVLVYRQPEISMKGKTADYVELSCPPLDRGGFLVQYRL